MDIKFDPRTISQFALVSSHYKQKKSCFYFIPTFGQYCCTCAHPLIYIHRGNALPKKWGWLYARW